MTAARTPVQILSVHRGAALRVVAGAQLGDPLGPAAAMVPEDVYRLSPDAAEVALSVIAAATPPFAIAEGSAAGRPGAALFLDCCATFMTPDGATAEVLILVETDAAGLVAECYALPLAPLVPRTDYALVGTDRDTALQRFARIACMSFIRGTLISLAGGRQVPVEDLRAGDRVMTRDDGAQPIRWIGRHTARATGAQAPIRIAAGALNNARDLLVSPDHRLFIYQRRDALGAGRAELLVRARHLVNGTTITRVEGGFVDHFQMLFDTHQILYAEGIAAESMLVDARTHAVLPPSLRDALAALLPAHAVSDAHAIEAQEGLLSHPQAAEVLRRASLG